MLDVEAPLHSEISEEIDAQFSPEVVLLNQENSIEIIKNYRISEDWEEVEAYGFLSDSARAHSFTATSLRRDGLIARTPVQFVNKERTACVMIFHFGEDLCGHEGIVHGGLAATILDEMLGYVAIPNLPNRTGFTANLNINYRRPIIANQWVVVRGELEKTEGRKGWSKAWIETIEDTPVILTEATALFVSPRVPPGPMINL